ncbi:MAG: 50S ribosomal protein L22 [Dehalococcoidales bacterium]|jgi:large subunit ribosomal protein L22
MRIKAVSQNTGLSPRKVRLLIDMVRGKKVEDALNILKFTPTPQAKVVAKVVKSAAANAENNYHLDPAELKVVTIYADEAPSMKRFRPSARGRAARYVRRSSHITVIVAEQEA